MQRVCQRELDYPQVADAPSVKLSGVRKMPLRSTGEHGLAGGLHGAGQMRIDMPHLYESKGQRRILVRRLAAQEEVPCPLFPLKIAARCV